MAKLTPNAINYKKYKRVFIFGCSFTNYHWPTWANILALEMQQAEIHNFGRPGAGNLYILGKIIEANQVFRFNNDDLVLVLWSTFCREDRYRYKNWVTPGNIFSQGIIDESFVKEWADPTGYVVRDMIYITSAKHVLSNLNIDHLMMLSVSPQYDTHKDSSDNNKINEVAEFYKDILNDFSRTTLHDVCKSPCGSGWTNGHQYDFPGLNKEDGTLFYDYHPNPKMYLQYVQNMGFNISDETVFKINSYQNELNSLKSKAAIQTWFASIANHYKWFDYQYKELF